MAQEIFLESEQRTAHGGDGRGDPAAYRYVGERGISGARVTAVSDEGVRSLAPTEQVGEQGYDWGSRCIAARELSRAILIDVTGNPALAERLCRPLTWEVIACLPAEGFVIGGAEVLAWMERQGAD